MRQKPASSRHCQERTSQINVYFTLKLTMKFHCTLCAEILVLPWNHLHRIFSPTKHTGPVELGIKLIGRSKMDRPETHLSSYVDIGLSIID